MAIDEVTVQGLRVESCETGIVINEVKSNDIDTPKWVLLAHDDVHSLVEALKLLGYVFEDR